jgi:dihydrolipoamide dehydrogenase
MSKQFDLIVLGGGRASALAIVAAKAGQKVALIEKDKLGGACLNWGCVPSKLLIGFAEAARNVRHADRHFSAERCEFELLKYFKFLELPCGGAGEVSVCCRGSRRWVKDFS